MRKKNQHTTELTPIQQSALSSYCQVCFTSFRRTIPRQLDEGLETLLCIQCGCRTHKCCYDLDTNSTFITQNLREFICERCSSPALKSKRCLVCYGNSGVFHSLEGENELVHIFCGLIHNQIDLVQYYPQIKFKKTPFLQLSLESKCELCGQGNAQDNCAMQSCGRKVHALCARKIFKQNQEQNDQPISWNYHISTGNNKTFQLNDQFISYGLFSSTIDQQLKSISHQLMGTNYQSIKLLEYQHYMNDIRKKRNNSKKVRRGGFSFVLCPNHQSDIYCICVMKGSGEMVFCDCCFQWYHQTCIQCGDMSKNQQEFICTFCRNFYQLKKKIVQEVRFGRIENNYQLKLDTFPKLQINDFIWLMRVIDHRIAQGSGNKMLKELVKYPLKSSRIDLLIRNQCRTKLNSLVENCIISYIQGLHFQCKTVLAIDTNNQQPIILQDNIEYNRKLKKTIQNIKQFIRQRKYNFNQSSSLFEWQSKLEKELEFKEQALSDSYETIIELSKINQSYAQIPILKIKAQAYSFLEIVKKVDCNTKITFEQLSQAVQKAKLMTDIPQSMSAPLLNKYKIVCKQVQQLNNYIKQNANNRNNILLSIQQLSKLYILPPIIYNIYQAQINLISNLFLLFQSNYQQSSQLQSFSNDNLNLQCKIKILLQQVHNITFSLELTTIIIQYEQQTNLQQNYIWQGTKQILQKYAMISFQGRLQQVLKSPSVSVNYLNQLIQNIDRIGNYKRMANDLHKFYLQWRQLKKHYQLSMAQSLVKCDNLQTISSSQGNLLKLINCLQQFPVTIRDSQGQSWLNSSLVRNEQLKQLKILFTEMQLDKYPLTLKKISLGLPKENQLVKQYYVYQKQYKNLKNKFILLITKINQRIELFKIDPKKQRKDQIRENSEKPTMIEIINLMQLLQNSKLSFYDEIEELEKIISNSKKISTKVNKFCEGRKEMENADRERLVIIRKDIDQLRKEVLLGAEVNLKSALIELYHLEIVNRMRTTLLAPMLEMDKIAKLLKFAEEEGLHKSQTYLQLRAKYEKKTQKSKQVTLVKSLEQSLAMQAQRNNHPLFAGLYVLRKQLTIPQLPKQKTLNPYLQELQTKNQTLRAKIEAIMDQKPAKYEFADAKIIYLQALKSPYQQPMLSKLNIELQKAQYFYKRWKQTTHPSSSNHASFLDYDVCFFKFSEIDSYRNQLKIMQESVDKLAILVSQRLEESCFQIQDIMSNLEMNKAIKDTEICYNARLQYIQYWVNLIKDKKISNLNNPQQAVYIPFQKLKKIKIDAYNFLQNLLNKRGFQQIIEKIRPSIQYLETLMETVKNQFSKSIEQHKFIVNNIIDIEDLYYEITVGADLNEQIWILKPFEDLYSFRTKNLLHIRQDTSWKRPHDINLQQKQHQIDRQSSQNSKQQVELIINQRVSEVVTEQDRRKIKEIYLRNIRKNPILHSYGSCEQEVRLIQNQVFGEWHTNVIKYLEISQGFQKLFIKLLECPNISGKVIKNKFQYKFINLLVENLQKIAEFETIMANKLKQQEQQKTLSKIMDGQNKIIVQSGNHDDNVFNMLAQGKMDASSRQTMKRQMKLIKESNKSKKKKKSKNKSRSRSPDAKFSSESQKNELPTYIQNQYSNTALQKDFNRNINLEASIRQKNVQINQPLLFDPQENQSIDNETNIITYHPKGTVLLLRNISTQIFIKRKGKIQIQCLMLTCEDHRRITQELIDPGCPRLSIRKEKPEQEIISYLSKPSGKKYKYLVGWLEATEKQGNENLKELSIEVNQRRKVLGWQNQHLKIHVMSIKQLVQINKLAPFPDKLSSDKVLELLKEERMVFIIQYPSQKMYQLKEQYENFKNIQKIQNAVTVSLPMPPPIPEIMDYALSNPYQPSMILTNYNPIPTPTIPELPQVSNNGKVIQYEGWGTNSASNTTATSNAIIESTSNTKSISSSNNTINTYNIIRNQFGFGQFSPILTDQQAPTTNQKPKNSQDKNIVDNLLNSLESNNRNLQLPHNISVIPPPPPTTATTQQSLSYGKQEAYFYQQRFGQQQQQQLGRQGEKVWNYGMQPMRYGAYNPMNAHQGQQQQHKFAQQYGQQQQQQYGQFPQQYQKNPMIFAHPTGNVPIRMPPPNPMNPPNIHQPPNPMNPATHTINPLKDFQQQRAEQKRAVQDASFRNYPSQ